MPDKIGQHFSRERLIVRVLFTVAYPRPRGTTRKSIAGIDSIALKVQSALRAGCACLCYAALFFAPLIPLGVDIGNMFQGKSCFRTGMAEQLLLRTPRENPHSGIEFVKKYKYLLL